MHLDDVSEAVQDLGDMFIQIIIEFTGHFGNRITTRQYTPEKRQM